MQVAALADRDSHFRLLQIACRVIGREHDVTSCGVIPLPHRRARSRSGTSRTPTASSSRLVTLVQTSAKPCLSKACDNLTPNAADWDKARLRVAVPDPYCRRHPVPRSREPPLWRSLAAAPSIFHDASADLVLVDGGKPASPCQASLRCTTQSFWFISSRLQYRKRPGWDATDPDRQNLQIILGYRGNYLVRNSYLGQEGPFTPAVVGMITTTCSTCSKLRFTRPNTVWGIRVHLHRVMILHLRDQFADYMTDDNRQLTILGFILRLSSCSRSSVAKPLLSNEPRKHCTPNHQAKTYSQSRACRLTVALSHNVSEVRL
jgi:hypothetical protein